MCYFIWEAINGPTCDGTKCFATFIQIPIEGFLTVLFNGKGKCMCSDSRTMITRVGYICINSMFFHHKTKKKSTFFCVFTPVSHNTSDADGIGFCHYRTWLL